MRLTAENLARAISDLPRDREYQYVNPSNKGRIVIHRVQLPEGPIEFKRYTPSKNEVLQNQPVESISPQMLWRMANAILPGKPVNVDRDFGGSYNTRSVLEALLTYTPQFYWCKPGRIEQINTTQSVRAGHKHLIYLPNNPHELGVSSFMDVEMQISEVVVDAVYEGGVTLEAAAPEDGVSIEMQRRHAQIQVALVKIGQQLGNV